MEETMYAADGVGLAAPQVGVSEHVVVVGVGDGPLHLINPEIIELRVETSIAKDVCPFRVFGYVERARVKVVI